jgi:hypothetical protein
LKVVNGAYFLRVAIETPPPLSPGFQVLVAAENLETGVGGGDER